MAEIKRIVLSGGGTGGHIYPALALYQVIKAKYPEVECLYVGSQKGLEADIVAKEGLAFQSIEIQGLKRSLSLKNLKTAWLMLTSVHKAKKILRDFKPDVVIGTGGYVCAPVLYAASRLGIPSLIHEQNSVAGVTNKFLSRFVNRIATCFEEVKSDFKGQESKIILTGNPRGQEVVATPKMDTILSEQFQLDDQVPTVLVFGGSRGAPAINQAAIEAIPSFAGQDYQVIVATGRVHYDELRQSLKQELPANVRLVPYIDNMPSLLRQIKLVVGRSGATSLTELTALGLPSILVPSPYVTNNHQEHNAMALVDHGAARMIKQADLTATSLVETIQELMADPKNLEKMAQSAYELGIRDASDRLVKVLEEICK